ncbi:unnamed protein product [Trichobilharzia regenti]|nr:unnamed protein product [Trichobilharzia regenti]
MGSPPNGAGYSPVPSPPPRLMAKLKCTLVPESALSKSLLQRSVNGNTEAVFALFLPEAGEYGLEIYANDPVKDGNSFFVVRGFYFSVILFKIIFVCGSGFDSWTMHT